MTSNPLGVETISTFSAENEEGAIAANYVEMIETVISSLEQDQSAMVSQADSGYLWKFQYGSVEVFVQLTGTEETDTLTVWAAVLKLPAKNEPKLMRHLLEMNCGEMLEACFAILNNEVVVFSCRTLTEISAAEISRIMTIVATIADEKDDLLKADYGAA
ncbi:MAG: YbjN domain-containing protein [Pseudanabaenales cyanobacterium]|nr:YbjN domain-containing protein [Pseudanabaenales cyanobacterium]